MQTVVLVVSHVKKEDYFLFRKKSDGSLPYAETWYGFGALLDVDNPDPEQAIKAELTRKAGIDIKLDEYLWWDTEVKQDLDGQTKLFVYLHTISSYVTGELTLGEGIEKLEWVHVGKLQDYDIVPPSRKFLDRYLNQ